MSEIQKNKTVMMKALIKDQFNNVLKGKSSTKLVQILQKYQLDPLCEKLSQKQIFYYIVAYVMNEDYLSLQHFCQRYNIQPFYPLIKQASSHAALQNIKEYSELFRKFIDARKQEYPNLKETLTNAMLKFILNIHSRYYLNVSVKSLQKYSPLFTVQKIKDLGYEVSQNYVQFKETTSAQSGHLNRQKVLMQKMNEIIMIAEKMTAYQ